MWLLNVATRQLESVVGNPPPYAIVSHTWGTDEVLFQDLDNGASCTDKDGYKKILAACRQASLDDLAYVWLDTCCIDKTNSAELHEAINAMWQYYREAQVCYVLLSDVSDDRDCATLHASLRRSRWFYRGWCLQELLAPKNVSFYNSKEECIGTRNKELLNIIVEITGIHEPVLLDVGKIKTYSIAQRMSWAAARKTTRIEDQAYCLLGIFDVHMPLLYGEGYRAFIRLQEEIIKVSLDHSILVWDRGKQPLVPSPMVNPSSLLAPSPSRFGACHDIYSHLPGTVAPDDAFEMTNQGLRITLPISSTSSRAALNCRRGDRICALKLVPYEARSKYRDNGMVYVAPDSSDHEMEQAEAIVSVRRQVVVLRIAGMSTDPIVQWSMPCTLQVKLVIGEEAGPVTIRGLHPPVCWDSRGLTVNGREISARFVSPTREENDLVGALCLKVSEHISIDVWFRVYMACGHSFMRVERDDQRTRTFQDMCKEWSREDCPTCALDMSAREFTTIGTTKIDSYRSLQYGIHLACEDEFGPAKDFVMYLLFIPAGEMRDFRHVAWVNPRGRPKFRASWSDLRQSIRKPFSR